MSLASVARIFLILTLGSLTIWSLKTHPIAPKELARRLPRCIFGLLCFGIGIDFFFAGALGNGPWDVFHGGIAKQINQPVGLVINVVGVLVLPLWIPLKERVGLGTVLNTLEIGLVVDLFKPIIPEAHNLAARWAYAVAALIIIAVGSGFYIGSGLGAGPRDGLMMGMRRLGISVRVARTIIEFTVLALGYFLGGQIGPATLLFMVGIGPLVQIALKKLSLPPLPPKPTFAPTVIRSA